MPDRSCPTHTHQSSSEAQVQIVPGGPVIGTIRPPGSKSLTNRGLICAAFAPGYSTLSGALRSEDTEVMIDALSAIGVEVDVRDGGRLLGVDGRTRQQAKASSSQLELFVANSGTTIRFLTAALSAAGGNYRLHGVPRMHERPIADLVQALSAVQVGKIETESPGGCPPVRIASDGWGPTEISVAGSVSSQYLSGLMMAAPIANLTNDARGETQIRVNGELVSRPYVEMTVSVMRAFGADVRFHESESPNQGLSLQVGADTYQQQTYKVEPDASAASYFWAAAAITGGSVTVVGLSRDAIQGDVGFCEVLQSMGCHVTYQEDRITIAGRAIGGIDINMNAISDTVQTLSVVALFANAPTRIRGVAHNRYKETDRIGHLATELRKFGGRVEEHDDGLTVYPVVVDQFAGATLETYNDHRMAMSLSLAGLRLAGVGIKNPACTAKTYPEFFADLEALIGRAHKWA